jgi:hypothetical protein
MFAHTLLKLVLINYIEIKNHKSMKGSIGPHPSLSKPQWYISLTIFQLKSMTIENI